MNGALWLAAGAALGFAVAMRLRPHSETTCAKRVAAGFAAELDSKCGVLGGLCTGAASALGLTDAGNANSVLDALGL